MVLNLYNWQIKKTEIHLILDAYALLSAVYLSQRKYDEAVTAGKKAISLDPNSSENHAIVAITM